MGAFLLGVKQVVTSCFLATKFYVILGGWLVFLLGLFGTNIAVVLIG